MRVSAGARPHGRAGTRTPMARLACRLGKFAAFCRTYTWLEIIARRGAATDQAKLARNLQLRSRTHKPDLALISFRIFWHSSLMPSTQASMVVGLCIWCGCVQRTPQPRQATTQRTMQETRTHPRESAATCLVAASRCAHRQPAAAEARAARRHAAPRRAAARGANSPLVPWQARSRAHTGYMPLPPPPRPPAARQPCALA